MMPDGWAELRNRAKDLEILTRLTEEFVPDGDQWPGRHQWITRDTQALADLAQKLADQMRGGESQ